MEIFTQFGHSERMETQGGRDTSIHTHTFKSLFFILSHPPATLNTLRLSTSKHARHTHKEFTIAHHNTHNEGRSTFTKTTKNFHISGRGRGWYGNCEDYSRAHTAFGGNNIPCTILTVCRLSMSEDLYISQSVGEVK